MVTQKGKLDSQGARTPLFNSTFPLSRDISLLSLHKKRKIYILHKRGNNFMTDTNSQSNRGRAQRGPSRGKESFGVTGLVTRFSSVRDVLQQKVSPKERAQSHLRQKQMGLLTERAGVRTLGRPVSTVTTSMQETLTFLQHVSLDDICTERNLR